MTDLEWTDEPPEEEGWYWIQEEEELTPLSPRVLEVTYSIIDEELIVDDPIDDSGIHRSVEEYEDVCWAGPIPRPSDPHQDQ